MIEDRVLQARPITDLLTMQSLPVNLFIPATENNGDTPQSDNIFNDIFYTDYDVAYGDNAISATIEILVPGRFELALAGLDAIAFGVGHDDFVTFTVRAGWSSDNFSLSIDGIELALRFSSELIQPAELDPQVPSTDPNYPRYRSSEDVNKRVVVSASGNLYLDKEFDIQVSGFDSFTLEPVKLPNLNSIYLVMEDVKLDLSRTDAIQEIKDAGFSADFQGLYIRRLFVIFQDDLVFLPNISAEHFAIGTGGISGKIAATFDLSYDVQNKKFEGDAAGKLFGDDGIAIGLRKFELELRANEVVSSDIVGQAVLPYFDKPVEIELSLDLKGNISLGLRGIEGDVLVELTKDDILSMKIKSFSFSKTDRELAFALGGSIKPLFGDGMNWPEFGVNNLIVRRNPDDHKWSVKLEGGWIEFQEAMLFSASGFGGELRKVGFGTVDIDGVANKFVGFSGGVGFVSGFALVAEFDDLLLYYDPPVRVELRRARLGLSIPGAVALIGEVSKRDTGFGGMIDVTVIPTQLRIMGGAEFGRTDGYSYMQILMAVELPPPGIVLGSTPVSILGFEGKFAMNMEPSMDPGWEWAVAPPKGIMPLSKLVPAKGGKMLGAGLKLATTDGTLLVVNALFALLLPGPVVMIEGRGAVLSNVFGQSDPTDPPFYALMVINGREKYFSANLAVNASLVSGVVKVTGTVGSFFDFQNVNNWYIKLGQKDPRNNRVKAIAYKVLEATAYFEAYSGPHLIFGGDIGVEERINFKVGHAIINAFITGDVDLSWKPQHATGLLTFIAEIDVRVCGFGAGLGAAGYIDAKSPYPRHLYLAADYEYFFNLPWPLPDVKGSGKFEKSWRDGQRYPCSFEPLINEVLVDSEIPGIAATPLTRFDSSGNTSAPAKLLDVPVVSLDARPTLNFAYPMNDETPLALAGNASNGPILHKIGDDEYKFSLRSIKLERFALPDEPADFHEALNASFDPDDVTWEGIEIPYGVWIADNSITGCPGATTLRLFSATAFAHFRQTMFSGNLQTEYGLSYGSLTSASLGDSSGDMGIFDADAFVAQVEAGSIANAADLTATMQDQVPEYPLGRPEVEWRYLGFANVPIQFGQTHVEVINGVNLTAVSGVTRRETSFDVIDLKFLPPSESSPQLHSVATVVRGVYFEEGIRLEFAVPVSECELYLFPVTRMSTSGDHYPDDWPDKDLPSFGACCETALELLGKLAEIITESADKATLKELTRFVETCCGKSDQPKDHELSSDQCYNKALELVAKVASATKVELAKEYLHDFSALLGACCDWKSPQDLTCTGAPTDDGAFLAYDLAPTASLLYHDYPPQIAVQRRRNGSGLSVPHTEHRDIVDSLCCVRVTADSTPFNQVDIVNSLADQGLFLITIGYLVDVDEGYDVDVGKIDDFNDVAWRGEDDVPVVFSPRSCYRLTVETAVDCDRSSPRSHVYYFRTDGPPAKDIKHYVSWTVPAMQDYPFFRKYDIGLRFRTNYVDEFYDDVPLQLHLKSGSGKTIQAETGTNLSWQEETMHLLLPEEKAYIDVLNASGAVTQIDPQAIPGDKSLIMSTVEPLESDEAYTGSLRMSAESNYQSVVAKPTGVPFNFEQVLPAMITVDGRTNTVAAGVPTVLGTSEDIQSIKIEIDKDASLFDFKFRTSKFLDFTDMFGHLVSGEEGIQTINAADPATLRADLNAVVNACFDVWFPSHMAIREKTLLIQLRLANEEDLLELTDSHAKASAQLDQAFEDVLGNFSEIASVMLQPLPKVLELYFSPDCIFIQLPESVEFARISVTYPEFEVLAVCSSDERRWLIFPVESSNKFDESGEMTFTYLFDIGDAYPRLRYESLNHETVTIALARD